MSSGFGYRGGPARCHIFWQEFLRCQALASEREDCVLTRDDYLECLHRTKEIARAKEIKAHFIEKQIQETHDKRQAAEKAASGVIVSLGLIEDDSGDSGKK
ncbi:hypothetical protein BCR39DRAFT_552149 [Naematelia encephala]|uniref:NADH dehydrogenase [ubiquinone] iron-sulfur protein 5 n=1 Tax=Naematelia encephala TaxID=71784 RepID=A0A1Y2AHS1_9TREE|nr:hypothetical protein BCR39DRAFT_552149 [Naematelia encephala]